MEWIHVVHGTSVMWCLWALAALRLTHVHMFHWQRLGFRLDRFRAFLPTRAGKEYLWNTLVWCKALLLLAIPVLVILGNFSDVFVWLIWGLLLWQAGLFVWELTKKTAIRPVYTVQAMIVIFLELLGEGIILGLYPDPEMFLYVEVLRPVSMSLLVLMCAPVRYLWEGVLLRRIRKERERRLDMIVIAITGSTGKTITRTFLQQLLQPTMRVWTADTDVSHTDMLQGLYRALRTQEVYDVILWEVQGYQQEEVERICRTLRPDIAIVTEINERHIGVMKTMERVQQTILEVVRHVPDHRGLVILNGDVRYPVEIMLGVYARQLVYSMVSREGDAYMVAMEQTEQGSALVMRIREEIIPVELPIAGTQYAKNFLAAATCARVLGVDVEHIQVVAAQSIPLSQRLEERSGMNNSVVLDDTYASHAQGIVYGLEVLAQKEGRRKVMILAGLEELGTYTEEIHRTLGMDIGQVVDECIVYDTVGIGDVIREGIQKSGRYGTHVVVCTDLLSLRQYIEAHIFEGDAVLLAHHIPASIRKILLGNADTKKAPEL